MSQLDRLEKMIAAGTVRWVSFGESAMHRLPKGAQRFCTVQPEGPGEPSKVSAKAVTCDEALRLALDQIKAAEPEVEDLELDEIDLDDL